jgi:DNA-binding Lrp family transcriptional regulator
MKTFEIEQYEVHTQTYRVEADNEADAIVKLLDGEGEPVDGSLDYIEIAEDLGLPVDECRELADQLRDLGVPVGEHVIPSIRAIVRTGIAPEV